jgi:hypothetical protein
MYILIKNYLHVDFCSTFFFRLLPVPPFPFTCTYLSLVLHSLLPFSRTLVLPWTLRTHANDHEHAENALIYSCYLEELLWGYIL